MFFDQINELSILVAAILAVAVGSIWYSPLLFGPLWMRSIGDTRSEGEIPKREILLSAVQGVLVHGALFVVLAYFLSFVYAGSVTFVKLCVLLTVLLSIHTVGTALGEKRSLAYILIKLGHTAIVIFGGLSIITFWPW